MAAPTLSSLAPASGSAYGGTLVTLTGTNFTAAAVVSVGGVAISTANTNYVSATVVEVIMPQAVAIATGNVNVTLTVPTQGTTGAQVFTYVAMTSSIGLLSVDSSAVQISPNAVKLTRGIKLSVYGDAHAYYGPLGVDNTTGFYINGVAEISPSDFDDISDIYVTSDDACKVTIHIVGQPGITIGTFQ